MPEHTCEPSLLRAIHPCSQTVTSIYIALDYWNIRAGPPCYARALPACELVTWQPYTGLYVPQDPDCSRGPCKSPKSGHSLLSKRARHWESIWSLPTDLIFFAYPLQESISATNFLNNTILLYIYIILLELYIIWFRRR